MRRDALAAPSTERRTGPGGGRRARLGPDQRTLGGQGEEEERKGKGNERERERKERERKERESNRKARQRRCTERVRVACFQVIAGGR